MIIAVGASGILLDIYTRYQGVLTDPSSISYVIYEPGDTAVASGAGHKESTGHYDARDSIIPSGYSVASSWSIVWTIVSPAGVTSTATEEFTVVSSLTSSFSNVDNLIDQLKLDLGITTEYTQAQFETFITKALNRLNRRLQLTDTTAELYFDDTTGTIQPTPNATIFDLILMQIECLIVKQARRTAVGKGIRVRDGDSEIDTTAGFGGHKDVVDDFCGELDAAINKLLYFLASTGGDIVNYANSYIFQIMSHQGDGSGEIRDFSSPFDSSGGESV